MNNKYFIYAIFVTLITTAASWTKMFGSATGTRGGSSWTSNSGGYTGGGGYSGGGHK
jgi:uncharacterized membrane protein YgcG